MYMVQGKGESYVWTDNVVEVLLNIVPACKGYETQENAIWHVLVLNVE